jgi:hypothetical protein
MRKKYIGLSEGIDYFIQVVRGNGEWFRGVGL